MSYNPVIQSNLLLWSINFFAMYNVEKKKSM